MNNNINRKLNVCIGYLLFPDNLYKTNNHILAKIIMDIKDNYCNIYADNPNLAGFQVEELAPKVNVEEFITWVKEKNYPPSYNRELLYKTFHYGSEDHFIGVFDLIPIHDYDNYIKKSFDDKRLKIIEFFGSRNMLSNKYKFEYERLKGTEVGKRLDYLSSILWKIDIEEEYSYIAESGDQELLQHLYSCEYNDMYSHEDDDLEKYEKYWKMGMKFTESQLGEIKDCIVRCEKVINRYKMLLN